MASADDKAGLETTDTSTDNGGLASLKRELLQSQKTRDELMKWKLVLVSAIGAAALGFSKDSNAPHAEFALCLIPFACCYVDLLCRNLSIRTKLLSRFMALGTGTAPTSAEARFECFYQEFDKERDTDALEGFALIYSTRLLSFAIVPAGIAAHFAGWPALYELGQWPATLFAAAGIAGLLGSWLVERKYEKQKGLLNPEKRESDPARSWHDACVSRSTVTVPAGLQSRRLKSDPDDIAPDASEIRLLPRMRGGSLCHCTLPPGKTSAAVAHREIEEIWYVVQGEGELWRKPGDAEGTKDALRAGVSVTIPPCTGFQFRNIGTDPLCMIIATMPPWPGPHEAYPVEGCWEAVP
jgi:mannose-6-phosphate isomerase-like protein (cupin superfamily)